jgi:hypothetical protein
LTLGRFDPELDDGAGALGDAVPLDGAVLPDDGGSAGSGVDPQPLSTRARAAIDANQRVGTAGPYRAYNTMWS